MIRQLGDPPGELSTLGAREFPRNNVSFEAAQATVPQVNNDSLAPGIVVAAANRLCCHALAATVERRFTVLGTGSTLKEAEQALEEHQPQVSLLVVDPPFPDVGFPYMCRQLVGRYPMTYALLVFRDRRPADLVVAYQQGARGLFDMTITLDELIQGLVRLAAGEVAIQPEILRDMMQARTGSNGEGHVRQPLTPTQTRVLALLSQGYTSKEIASMMRGTTASVNHNIERASQRLGARHRAEAVARALRLGIIT